MGGGVLVVVVMVRREPKANSVASRVELLPRMNMSRHLELLYPGAKSSSGEDGLILRYRLTLSGSAQ